MVIFSLSLKKKHIDWERSQWGDDEVVEILRCGIGVRPTAPLSVPSRNHPSQAGVHVPQLPEEPGIAILIPVHLEVLLFLHFCIDVKRHLFL